MNARTEAKNKVEAWNMAQEIFPGKYELDQDSSDRAGYPVYRDPDEFYNYICDLGDRLEINLKSGKAINIWVMEPEPKKKGGIEVTHYRSYIWAKDGLRPEELDRLARKIFESGKITSVYHQAYGTNDPAVTHGDEWATVNDGGVAYTVEKEGFPLKFIVHMNGLEVSEIIEQIQH